MRAISSEEECNRYSISAWDYERAVAKMLVQEMLGRLSGTITLNVGANNRAARQLYERLGLVIDREFTGRFNGHDVSVMTLKFERAG